VGASRQPGPRSDIERRPKLEFSGGTITSDAGFPADRRTRENPWRAVDETGQFEPAWALDRPKQIDHCLMLLFKTAQQNQAVAQGTDRGRREQSSFDMAIETIGEARTRRPATV